MNEVLIHRHHTIQVYKMAYVIGMKHEYDMKHENEHAQERQYVMNT